MTLISSYGLIVFTDFVPSPETRFLFGWVIIAATFAILAVNLCVLIYESIADSCRQGKIRMSKRKYQKITLERMKT